MQVLRQLPFSKNRNVAVNSSTLDDAGAYRLDLSRPSGAEADRHRALVPTKPLGTGIVTTGIKRGLTSRALAKKTIALMTKTNSVGAELAERGLVRAAIDITGFGLLGHLASMCRASGTSAEISVDKVPVIDKEVFDLIARDCVPGGSRDNLQAANKLTDWKKIPPARRIILTDAQTSGGLLLCVKPSRLEKVRASLKRNRILSAAVIGKIIAPQKALLSVQ